MNEIIHTLRVAGRSLLRSRRFTVLTVATLAFGIGITTVFFSVFDAVLLRPLAYGDGERLITVLEPERSPTSPANFLALREGVDSLEQLTAASPWQPVLRGEGPAEQLAGLKASRDLFELLGVEPMLGRAFADGDGSSLELRDPRADNARAGLARQGHDGRHACSAFARKALEEAEKRIGRA